MVAATGPAPTPWVTPTLASIHRSVGRARREDVPRRALAELPQGPRDPLGILRAQNATRLPELVPLRRERMSESAFAFYRGTAALMAADLAASAHTGIVVASCGDAHVSNFGLYASPQRTLVFDLNDFDEAAWAPWEWDLKRLVTSIVIAGQSTGRDDTVVREAATSAALAYATSMNAGVRRTALERYYEHFDAAAALDTLDPSTRRAVKAAMREAQKQTGLRATRRLTEADGDGRLRFIHRAPTMTPVPDEIARDIDQFIRAYATTASVDIRMLLQQYVVSDIARRVVGVGSVGTRCFVIVLQDSGGNALLLQAKEAGRSVLEENGLVGQPPALEEHRAAFGEGGRVVALQRILQAFSDPFLGHMRGPELETGPARGFYVRQFHDMKGGFDADQLDDESFRWYAQACATTLARAHGQSATSTQVAGYVGGGRTVAEAIVEWAYGYARISHDDYTAFLAAGATV